MLLENPKTRFGEDKLWLLRHRANLAIRDKSNQHYPLNGRDYGYSQSNIITLMRNRKTVAARISAVIKQRTNDIKEAGQILPVMNSTYGLGTEAVDRMEQKKYGFYVRASVIQNHKQEWLLPVWYNEDWFQDSPYHFYHDVHQSEEDPTQISYNRSIDNIRRNIQTRTRPGKYLMQFFGDVLSAQDIKYWAERQVAAATCVASLKFIENDDPDGWVDVYERGPASCMRGKSAVKVYALEGNGLRLAYLEANEEIVARCIVVDGTNDAEVNGWIRIYAREQRWETSMRQMLNAAGYTERTNLDGVRLQLIEGRDGYVCPYIDYGEGGDQTVSADHQNNCLVIGGGDFDATSTDGYVNQGEYCPCCDEHGFREDDMTYIECEDQNVCSSCRDYHYTYAYGRRYEDWFPNNDVIYCETDGNYYHQDYYGNHDIVYVESREEYYHIDDTVCCDVGKREGEHIHVNDYATDHISGEIGHEDEFVNINGNSVHELYVVSCYVSKEDADIRECVEIRLGAWVVRTSTRQKSLYIHQDNLTADVILSDFVRCGDLLLPNTYYGNPVDCFEPSNVSYGDEYSAWCPNVEDLLVADAEERLAA
jgi:hypothetical protein